MSQAILQIDSAASATLSTTAVLPVLNGAVTGTGGAVAAQVTLASLATFLGTQAQTLTSPTTLGSVGAAFTLQGTTVASASDVASGAITFNGNIGRGTGAVGGFVFAVPVTTSTGSTAQTLGNALVVKATTVPIVYTGGAEAIAAGIISQTLPGLYMHSQTGPIRAANIPSVQLTRVEGTFAAPTIVGSAATLGSISFRGCMTASTALAGAAINAITTEAWVASTSAGTKLELRVTPNATAALATALTLNQDLSAAFGGFLDITGAPGTAASSHVTIGGVTRTTIGANGGATALTAVPLGYLDINVGGTIAQIPYYNRGA